MRCGSLRFTLVLWHLWQIDDFLVGPDALDRTCAGCFFLGRAPDTARCGMLSGPPLCGRRPTASTVQGRATWCVSHGPRRCPMFTLLTGSWKWLIGSRSKPFFVPQGQPASYRFFPKSLAARFCTRLRLCGHCRSFSFSKASIKHSEGAGFYASSLVRNNFACSVQLHGSSQHHRDNHNIGFCFCSKYGTFSFKVFGPLWKVNCGQNLRKRWKTVGIMLMLVSFQQEKCSGYPRKSELCQVGIV